MNFSTISEHPGHLMENNDRSAKQDMHSGNIKEGIRRCYKNLIRQAQLSGNEKMPENLQPAYRRFELGLFRLVVMGEIKKGKSSFINALLGEPNLLPTASDIATSTVYKLLYGPEKRFKVFYKPDANSEKRKDPKQINEDELEEYGTEKGNPGNQKGVAFISVELPNALLKEGLVIIDTPGVGGLYKYHKEVTLQYAPNADAVIFVLDSTEAVISRDEIEFLKGLVKKATKRIFFVQTKIDAADTETWKAWQQRNQRILQEEVGIPLERQVYFPVSAEIKLHADQRKSGKHLERSGYLTVLNYLNKSLIPAKEKVMAADFARQLLGHSQSLSLEQQQKILILQQDSKEKLASLHEALQSKKREFTEWTNTLYRQETQKFQDSLNDLKRRFSNKLRDQLAGDGEPITGLVEGLHQSDDISAKEINDKAQRIQQDLITYMGTVIRATYEEFNQEFFNLIKNTVAALNSSLPVDFRTDQTKVATLNTSPLQNLGIHLGSLNEKGKNVLYSGMAGGTIAMIGIGLIGLVFPPALVLTTAASLIGVFAGGYCGYKDAAEHKKREAISHLNVALSKLANKIQIKTLSQFDDLAIQLERQSRTVFQQAMEMTQGNLQKQIDEVESTAKSTREENHKKLEVAKARLEACRSLVEDIKLIARG